MRVMRFVIVLALVAGCGPIVYVNEVTRHAADAVDEARAAEAPKYSPYYWTRAIEFYTKAKVLAAHADFQAANRYGRLASEAAEQALAETEVAKKDPTKRPLELQQKKPETAPAKDDEPPAPAKEEEKPPPTDPATPKDPKKKAKQ